MPGARRPRLQFSPCPLRPLRFTLNLNRLPWCTRRSLRIWCLSVCRMTSAQLCSPIIPPSMLHFCQVQLNNRICRRSDSRVPAAISWPKKVLRRQGKAGKRAPRQGDTPMSQKSFPCDTHMTTGYDAVDRSSRLQAASLLGTVPPAKSCLPTGDDRIRELASAIRQQNANMFPRRQNLAPSPAGDRGLMDRRHAVHAIDLRRQRIRVHRFAMTGYDTRQGRKQNCRGQHAESISMGRSFSAG